MPKLKGSAETPRYREGPNKLPNGGKEYMRIAIAAKRVAMLVLTLSLAVAIVACQGAVGPAGEPGEPGEPGKSGETPKLPPVLLAPFPAVMLVEEGVDKTVDASLHFHDPEGGALAYTASSSDESVATAEVAGSMVTIGPEAMGDAIVTVTATDPDGQSQTAEIMVSVAAEGMMPPIYLGTLDASIPVLVNESSVIPGADVVAAFDEEEGESLTFAVSVNPVDNSIVRAIIEPDNTVTILAVAVGEATVTIAATDEDDATTPHDIMVTVVGSSEPAAVGMIDAQSLMSDGGPMDVDVSGAFSDPLGDALSYVAESSDPAVATASAVGSVVTITPVSGGPATVTVTATNSRMQSAMQTIDVTVTVPPVPVPGAPAIISTFAAVSVPYGDTTARTYTLSEYFAGADVAYAVKSGRPAVAIASESGGVLSITPVAPGQTNVMVTASNAGGQVSQNITVEVAARPNMKPTVKETLADLRRIPDADRTDEVVADESKWEVMDLGEYFADPENIPLTFAVEIGSQTPDGHTGDVVELVVKPSGYSMVGVQVDAIAVGTAMIKVTATDSEGQTMSQTFEMTVVASNDAPTSIADPTGATPVGTAVPNYSTDSRFKLSDASKKAIDNQPISAYFADGNLGANNQSDVLTFTVMYVATGTGSIDGTTMKLTGQTAVDDDKVVATAVISPNTWDGDAGDKFTVTVTPKMAGAAHDILIVATDLGGEQAIRRIPVQVNRPPLAEGAQATNPLKLSEYKAAEGLRAGADNIVLELDDATSGYFHDDDTDTLTCSAVPSVTGTTAPAVVSLNADRTQLTLNITDTFTTSLVPMTVTVKCTDGWGTGADAVVGDDSPSQTFTVSVTSV